MRMRTIWLASMFALAAACGGGGGGDDSDGGSGGGTDGGGTGGGGTGGGGGGGGSTTLTEDQRFAQNTAVAITESTKQVVAGDQSAFLPIAAVVDNPSIVDLIRQIAFDNLELPGADRELPIAAIETSTIPFSEAGDCGGTYSGTQTITGDDTVLYPFDVESTGTLTNFCLSVPPYTATYSGDVSLTAHYESFDSYDFTIDLDLTYTTTIPDAPAFGSIEIAQSCLISAQTTIDDCTYSTTFQGEEAVYTVSDVEISGDGNVGYSLSGDFTDDDGNTYTFVADQITFCINGNVQGGSIDVTVNGGDVINISYPNCNQMIITYKGESRTVSQNL